MTGIDEDALPAFESRDDEQAAAVVMDKLFNGDCGELPLETRRCLVQLLRGPAIDALRHPNLWTVLLREEQPIRKQLAELFLELVIDRDLKVAFTRQMDTGELDVPRLLRRVQLTFIESILLLNLRQRLTQADSYGERAVVATEEIIDALQIYERNGSTDRAGFDKRIKAAIEKFKKHKLLYKIGASEDRLEISPTLKLLFPAEEIAALTELYHNLEQGEVSEQITDAAPKQTENEDEEV